MRRVCFGKLMNFRLRGMLASCAFVNKEKIFIDFYDR
jgi:hypothetical protein